MTKLFQKILIIGGGIGGLKLATSLGKKLGKKNKADITLIDKNYTYLWKPLLHEVAAGSIDGYVNSINYLPHSYNNSFCFQIGRMIDIDRKNKQVILDEIRDSRNVVIVPYRKLMYDILVVAIGSVSNDFGIIGVKDHCIFLDDLHQAKQFYNGISNLFHRYDRNDDVEDLNIVIVGGGATGVELSAELYNTTIKKLNKHNFISSNRKNICNIILIEAGNRILPMLPETISSSVYQELVSIGIKIIINTMIIKVDEHGLYTKGNKYIKADLIIWTAGVKAPDFMNKISGLETNHINQLLVRSTLQTTYDPYIFAIGDCASYKMSTGIVVPPRAQASNQMASCVYFNILALLYGKKMKNYTYNDYGSIISLSKYNTIGFIAKRSIYPALKIKGRIARFIYVILYRIYQISLYGYIKTFLIILMNKINRIIRSHDDLY